MCFEGVVVTCSKFKLQTILDMSTEKMPPTLPPGSVGRSSSSRGNEDNNSYRLKYRGQTEHEQGEVVNNRIYVGGLGDCIIIPRAMDLSHSTAAMWWVGY